jgi:hypothetical protein
MYVIVLLLLLLLALPLLVSSSERCAADTTAATAAAVTAVVAHSNCALCCECCNHRSEGIAGSGKWLVLVVMTSSIMPYSRASFGVMKKSRSVSSSICQFAHTSSGSSRVISIAMSWSGLQ